MDSMFDNIYAKETYIPVVEGYHHSYMDGFQMQQHMHSLAEMMCVTSGEAQMQIDGEEVIVQKNEIILIDACTVHSLSVDKNLGTAISCIEFDFKKNEIWEYNTKFCYEESEQYRNFIDQPRKYCIIKDTDNILANIMLQIICYMKNSISNEDSLKIASLLTMQLLLMFSKYLENIKMDKDEHKKYKYITQAIEYINENYMNNISVNEVANHIFIHPSYLHRLFKQITGVTMNNYLCNKRFDAAKKLLETTDYSIMRITMEVGINSQPYFANQFSKKSGYTPSKYRKKFLDERNNKNTI